MSEFFKPWRRKAGCLTLVMACMFLVGWVRSGTVDDRVHMRQNDQTLYLLASDPSGLIGATMWVTGVNSKLPPTSHFGWNSSNWIAPNDWLGSFTAMMLAARYSEIGQSDDSEDSPVGWNWHWCGFHLHGTSNPPGPGMFAVTIVVVPYWSVVLPLMLLSAWLLFSKPRQTAPTTSDEPAPTIGA